MFGFGGPNSFPPVRIITRDGSGGCGGTSTITSQMTTRDLVCPKLLNCSPGCGAYGQLNIWCQVLGSSFLHFLAGVLALGGFLRSSSSLCSSR